MKINREVFYITAVQKSAAAVLLQNHIPRETATYSCFIVTLFRRNHNFTPLTSVIFFQHDHT